MNRDQWMRASTTLHALMLSTARVQAPMVVGVVELHRPKRAPQRGLPVCHGCDKADPGFADPEWPCRTFATLAKDLLDIKDVEDHLERLKTH